LTAPQPPSRLDRRLGVGDAVVIGMASMIGAGVFAAIGPAAAAAGGGLLVGLVVAGGVAFCNATSSARLAAIHPQAGGSYVYGRERLGPFWGHLAGWGFVVGKTASCAAMALTFGSYVAPSLRRPLAVGAVVAIVAVNHRGITKTSRLTRVLVVLVLLALAAVVVAAIGGGEASVDRLDVDLAPRGILESAGLLFFAFAGYARIATLGEEVVDPARTIPRAVPIALGITLAVYAVVAVAALLAVGPDALARSVAPLDTAARAGSLDWLAPAVRAGGAIASLGVLLSLLAGVARTAFAMAANGELPASLATVHPVHRVPHRAQVAVGAAAVVLVALFDVRHAIGFSACTVLVYYAVTNAAAWTLGRQRWIAACGFVGCVVLALTLPIASVLTGFGVLAIGAAAWLLRRD
jgi:basic amino acid/polyamine antiporter, APA family